MSHLLWLSVSEVQVHRVREGVAEWSRPAHVIFGQETERGDERPHEWTASFHPSSACGMWGGATHVHGGSPSLSWSLELSSETFPEGCCNSPLGTSQPNQVDKMDYHMSETLVTDLRLVFLTGHLFLCCMLGGPLLETLHDCSKSLPVVSLGSNFAEILALHARGEL
jgi:hypothetical protein